MLREEIKFAAALAYKPFIGSCRKVVLCYHSLKPAAVMNFRQHMAYLADRCDIISPSQIMTATCRSKPMVAVTVDDAFVSFDENAVPVLKEFNIPAGVFVPTGYIGKPCGWQMPKGHADQNETVLDCARLRELSKDGIEVFSHTVSHPNLTTLSAEPLRKELADSKAALEQLLGRCVDTISYPHGRHDENVLKAARDTGYRLGFTIEPHCVDATTNPLAIGRFVVSPNEPLLRFRLKACGAYAAENVLRNLKQRLK